MKYLRRSARVRRSGPRDLSKSGLAGLGSIVRLVKWAKPRASCNNFNIFIFVAMRSMGISDASHVPWQGCEKTQFL